MKKVLLILLLMLSLVNGNVEAQVKFHGQTPHYDQSTGVLLITVPENAFGKSCHIDVTWDYTVKSIMIDSVALDDTGYNFPMISGDAAYTLIYTRYGKQEVRTLRFTYLPTIKLSSNFNRYYQEGTVAINFPDSNYTVYVNCKVRWAGATTLKSDKHSYHIKFCDGNGDKMDRKFFGLRNDNHWRLDAGTIDMLRIRNRISNELWADFASKPYYSDLQSGAKSYIRGDFVEVFAYNNYLGFYSLCEYMDRKQMKLKKYEEVDSANYVNHGLLWKTKEAYPQAMFASLDDCDESQESWGGHYMQYPDMEEVGSADYSVLYNLIDFVMNSSDAEFKQHIADYIDWPVLVDYYVFLDLLYAKDNVAKNMYWACYDKQVDTKITLAVWDLDAVLGQNWSNEGDYYHAYGLRPENDFGTVPNFVNHRLFQRLIKMTKFKADVLRRYQEAVSTVFNPDSIVVRFETALQRLDECGALDREAAAWTGNDKDLGGHELDFEGEMDYLDDWIHRRVDYLNRTEFHRLIGDVNQDFEVNISDANEIVSYITTEGKIDDYTLSLADLDGDGVVSISDVNLVIDIVLGLN